MAANRICKVLKVNQDNERLMEEYERLASDVRNRFNYAFLSLMLFQIRLVISLRFFFKSKLER